MGFVEWNVSQRVTIDLNNSVMHSKSSVSINSTSRLDALYYQSCSFRIADEMGIRYGEPGGRAIPYPFESAID